ncbi:hypothetical protein P691DRAFT_781855 [Macrolepiota fuliginosa MF-IS2]|uniref:Uncharacterized protein n=1 Tax=Macrolepiota fuliginosa MF-IS2 TaxID=1400762 RepID=A0A9P5XCL6_9AGAR|nr:hypothetical protein P691DRAFT_781855 [Macrolepiota fuliginosa MF-IS2]
MQPHHQHRRTPYHSIEQPNVSIGSHHLHGRQSLRPTTSQHPPVLRRGYIPLPNTRLSPLIDEEEPLPFVPFITRSGQLDRRLRRGEWRELRSPHRSHRSRVMHDALLNPATLPEKRELMVVINSPGQAPREVWIRPRAVGATVVSVGDVIDTVEREAARAAQQRPAGGSYNYARQSVCRGPDGIWRWRGLAETRDGSDAWVLYL